MNNFGGAGTIPATGQTWSDFPGQSRKRAQQMAAATPTLPQASKEMDTFGAAGAQPNTVVRTSVAAGAAVRGLIMLIGILVLIRVAWEFAEDATD